MVPRPSALVPGGHAQEVGASRESGQAADSSRLTPAYLSVGEPPHLTSSAFVRAKGCSGSHKGQGLVLSWCPANGSPRPPHSSPQSILAPLMDDGDSDKLQEILGPCPLAVVRRGERAPSQEGTCPGGTVSESGQGGDIPAMLPGREAGAGGGKEAAGDGVKGTGGRKGQRRAGNHITPPPLPAAERLTEKA